MAEAVVVAVVVAVAAVHLVAGHLQALSHIPRQRWLSFAGGVSTSFVFLELLPALARGERALGGEQGASLWRFAPYLVALAGLVLFYGVEHAVKRSKRDREARGRGGHRTGRGVFWASMASWSLFNLLAGYILVEEQRHLAQLLLFALALALHDLVTDRALYEDHRHLYEGQGRWVVVGAFLAGALVAGLGEVRAAWLAVFYAFVTGAILLNVVKEELPEERDARWGAFVAGAAAYGALYLGAHALG